MSRHKLAPKTLRRISKNEVLRLDTVHSSAFIQKPRYDPENPRTKKFSTSLLSQIFHPFILTSVVRTRADVWRSIKENPAIPTIRDLSDETRTRLYHHIYNMGSSPSIVVSSLLGITARQVGAFRRWNIPNWRKLTNQHIKNATNINRVVVKR